MRGDASSSRGFVGDAAWRYCGLVGAVVLSVVTLAALDDPLPDKYYYDSRFIASIASGTNYLTPDSSYQSAATVYGLLGLAGDEMIVLIVSMGLYAAALCLALPPRMIALTSSWTMGVAFVSIIPAAVYIGTYSKELVVLGAVCVLIPLASLPRAPFWMTLFTLAYAAEFRAYWALIAIFFVGLLPARRRLSRLPWLILSAVLLVAVIIFMHSGENLSSFRLSLNSGRSGAADASSLVPQYLAGDGFVAGYVNAIVTFILLVVPIPLLLTLQPLYLATAVTVSTLTFWTARALRRGSNSALLDEHSRDDGAGTLLLLMALSMVLVQSIYVPDFGSAVKHLSPMIPLFVAGFARIEAARQARGECSMKVSRGLQRTVQPASQKV